DNLVGQSVVDVADKAQRQMIVLRIDPAGAGQSAAHHGERLTNRRRDFNSGEQAGHDNLRTSGSRRSRAGALLLLLPGDSRWLQNGVISALAQPSRDPKIVFVPAPGR